MENEKKEKRKRFTEAERNEYAQRYIRSHKTKIEMSKEIGINTKTLSSWLKKYNVENSKSSKNSKNIKNEDPVFIEIEVMPKMVIDKKSIAKPIQIQIGKIKLEMEEGYEFEKMMQVVRVVAETC